jgi:hypothetical protein
VSSCSHLAQSLGPREEYVSIRIESVTVYAMGRDPQGAWWVQAWTNASPEFEGEQGEQWFVTRYHIAPRLPLDAVITHGVGGRQRTWTTGTLCARQQMGR